MELLSRLSKYDTFQKAHQHVQVRTGAGAVLSMLTMAIMGVLLISEFMYFRATTVENHLVVDKTQGDRDMTIELDILFPSLKCKDIEIRVEDSKSMSYEDAKLRVAREAITATGEVAPPTATDAPACHVHGYITIKRVAGTLMILAGHIPPQFGGFVMMMPPESVQYNVSHVIRRLTFGPAFPGQARPLDGIVAAAADKGAAQYQYHVKLVPTLYEPLMGRVIDSEQFSATDFVQVLDPAAGVMGQPGLWFRFDFSPIMVRLVETRRHILGFFVSVCAILGGVFTLSGLVDQLLHRALETRKSK